ncbi:MAG: VWA domain-containing protein [Luteolibacter sp.]
MNFSSPIWLLLLLFPPLLGLAAFLVARVKRGRWGKEFVAPRLREKLLKRSSVWPHWLAMVFTGAALASMAIAMARPQGDAGTRSEKSLGRNVLFAIDLSRSMLVQDVKPNRLSHAKLTLYELMDGMKNERIGVMGFAGSAYVHAPLTVDHQAVRETVEQIDEQWVTRGGSELGEALRVAIQTLKETGQRQNALILLSDGENHDDEIDSWIAEAVEAGIHVVAIGIGTEDGGYVPNPDFPMGRMVDRDGRQVISRLQPDTMKRLASETRGRYAAANGASQITNIVRNVLGDLDTFELEGRQTRVMIEFYQWFLLPAILLMIATVLCKTRWRTLSSAWLFGILLGAAPEKLTADRVADAREMLLSGQNEQARELYRELAESTPFESRRAKFHLGEASAAFASGEFFDARKAYSAALLGADPQTQQAAHLGLGKSLFQISWLSLDQNPYPSSPDPAPSMEDFDRLVGNFLGEMQKAEDGSEKARRIERLVVDWTDAVRHFDSAKPHPDAQHNRMLVMQYLNRLIELLEQDRQETQEQMPPEPPPAQGDSSNNESPDGESDEPNPDGDSQGDSPKENSGESDPSDDPSSEGPRDQDEGNSETNPESPADTANDRPDESPEERARRILGENSDLEKGPPIPGQHEFRAPEKDW